MSSYSNHGGTATPEAFRSIRAERRRRQIMRRRLTALAVVLLALAAVIVGLVVGLDSGSTVVPRAHPRAVVRDPRTAQTGAAAYRLTPAQLLTARENAAIDRLLARQPFISAGGTEQREIALTFDDGPGPYTPQVLNELQRLHVPATFFEIGFMFRWFHASVTREVQMGEVIGDHTETHPEMARLSRAAQRLQILQQTQWLHKYGAPFPRLWRPPYGSYDAATLATLHQYHMLMVLWTVDTDDYLRPGVATIVHRALSGARPGAIILLHDAGGNRSQTIAALPKIVAALRKRGYELVTVPQLILTDPPQGRQTLPAHVSGD